MEPEARHEGAQEGTDDGVAEPVAHHPDAAEADDWGQNVKQVRKAENVEVQSPKVRSYGRVATRMRWLGSLSLAHITIPLDVREACRSPPPRQVLQRHNYDGGKDQGTDGSEEYQDAAYAQSNTDIGQVNVLEQV